MNVPRAAWAAALIGVMGLAGCRTADLPPQSARALDAYFSNLHERGLFDGAVVVGDARRVWWEKGYGLANREAGTPFTPQTPSDGGSLAKPLTAALILQLAEEGRLDLEDPARKFLPALPYPEITLRHLLSHSSGLPDYDWFEPHLGPDQIRTTEVLLAVLGEKKPALRFAPGSRFEYSSLAFDLAALAASRAAGKPFDALMRERFFEPLQMQTAFFRPGRLDDFPEPRTLGYRRVDDRWERFDVFDLEAFHGGSNIYFSARDLHHWNRSLLKAASPATLEATIAGAPSGLTLGSWYSDPGRTAFWYSGHHQGFHSVVFRDLRSRRSIVYTSNNTIDPWLQHGIIRAVSAILDGRKPEVIVTLAQPEGLPEALAGTWVIPQSRLRGQPLALETIVTGKRMELRQDGVRYPMFPVGSGAYYVPGLDYMIGFDEPVDGRPGRMIVSTNVELASARRSSSTRP